MIDVYLYNEDISGYQFSGDLPFSDTSEYISGELNQDFTDEQYFNSKIKKAFKGQYYQNQVFNFSGEGEFDCLEEGYYKVTLKANDGSLGTGSFSPDADPSSYYLNLNDWWTSKENGNSSYSWWKDSTQEELRFQHLDKSDTTKIFNHEWSYGTSSGYYEIYDQVTVLYITHRNGTKLEVPESAGIIDFSFINTEAFDEFRDMVIKCKSTEIFYGKTFTNSGYQDTNNITTSQLISYSGIDTNQTDEFWSEYGITGRGNFFRKKYDIKSGYFKKWTPTGAGGLSEVYEILNVGSKPYNTIAASIGTGEYQLSSTPGLAPSELTSDENYTYQYKEYLGDYNGASGEVVSGISVKNQNGMKKSTTTNAVGKKTPIQSVGVTTDIFGFHKFIEPASGYLQIEYLGPKTLSTVKSSYNTPISDVTILQDNDIIVPRNTSIKYDFIYDKDLIQINRGEWIGEPVENNTAVANISGSYVEKRKDTELIEVLPLSDICHFTRNSDYSESIDFTLGLYSYSFNFVSEPKRFRVYFDPRYIVKSVAEGERDIAAELDSYVTSIKVSRDGQNYFDITKDHPYYELLGATEQGEDKWSYIKIIYNRANWGLVRDFTAFSSRLVKLLDENGASWTYNLQERADIIKVKLTRDIRLDLSHQNTLYLLYVMYVKENNTIDKEFYLSPLRLKLGRVPYTICRGDSLPSIYVTEGESLWLDWGFKGDDKDFIKKLYVNETLSVLPTTYRMYYVNVWPYNQSFSEDVLETSEKGVEFDINEVASEKPEDKIRDQPFQVLNFSMPPQTFTLKLVISFQHYKFNFHRDQLGIIDPYISATEFIPGDIIKLSFKLDRYHTLTAEKPTLDFLKESPAAWKDPYTYQDFLAEINNLQSYRSTKLDKNFSFYLLDKNFVNEKDIFTPVQDMNLKFMVDSLRAKKLPGWEVWDEFYYPDNTKINHEDYFNKLKKLPDEHIVNLYLTGMNADIDLWLQPRLFPNNTLFIKKEEEVHYYLVEESGWYAAFLAGGRCGNGGDGANGLDAGFMYENNYPKHPLWIPGRSGVYNTTVEVSADENHKHPYSGKDGGAGNQVPGRQLFLWGKSGGDGGSGWIGGNGGKGGEGTQMFFSFGEAPLKFGIGVWHWGLSTTLSQIRMPCLMFSGGKCSGNGGMGGGGKYGGIGGGHGNHQSLGGGSASINGSTYKSKTALTVRCGSTDKVFLKKNTLLLCCVGSNGKDGLNGAVEESFLGDKYNYSLDSKSYDRFNGGGGGPGSVSVLGVIYSPEESSNETPFFDIKVNNSPTKNLYALPRFCEDFDKRIKLGSFWSKTFHVEHLIKSDGDLHVGFPDGSIIFGWEFIIFQTCCCGPDEDENWNEEKSFSWTKKNNNNKYETWSSIPNNLIGFKELFEPSSMRVFMGTTHKYDNEYCFELISGNEIKQYAPLGGQGGLVQEDILALNFENSEQNYLLDSYPSNRLSQTINQNTFCNSGETIINSIGPDDPVVALGFINAGFNKGDFTNDNYNYKFSK